MQIHTTQDLNVFKANYPSAQLSHDFRFKNQPIRNSELQNDTFEYNVSFGKRIPFNKPVGQTLEKHVKNVKDMLKGGRGPVDGPVNNFLETTTKQEVWITAIVSAVFAGVLRPVTLFAIANDNERKDMAYASSHAISSALWGLIVPLIFIKPLAKGYNKALENAHLHLSAKEFKARFPQADIENPKNWLDGKVGNFDEIGKLKPIKEQIDRHGNKLITDIKDVFKIPLPKHSSEISKETYSEYFDEAGNIKTAKNVYITMVNESKAEKLAQQRSFWDKLLDRQIKPKYYELNECTDEVLIEAFPTLDVKTVGVRGNRDFSKAKSLDGTDFKLDKNFCYVSDWRETDKAVPYSTGETFKFEKTSLFGKKRIKIKDVCYQKNGAEHGKGTPIDEDMVVAAGVNEVHNKFGQWLPDITIAYPRATATIALLPFILKNVFHLEKSKPAPVQAEKAGA